ncbi:MAG: hypothetical protein C5B57_04315 [Blastocatellia bacterium]|nr:MAG: hypothetical protein C5B57_04315 [Blastocatellia bacterium]
MWAKELTMSVQTVLSRREFATLGAAVALGLTSTASAQSQARAPLRSEFLMDLVFKTGGGGRIGPRIIAGITNGTFEGPKLKGKVTTPAGEWGATRPDGAYVIDVRLELRTDDDALIFVSYRGIVYTPPKDQGGRYWVTAPVFETASTKYDWLNRIVCVGVAYTVPKEVGDVAYHIYQILM